MKNPNTSDHFSEYGWAYAPNLLDKYECKNLTDYLFLLKKENKTKKGDTQCPLSDAIYGEKYLDFILESLCPKVSKLIGISLLPTYSYSRIYRKNDHLKIHKDRASCEISVTLTLGHDDNSDVWPIFFSKTAKRNDVVKQTIAIGDGVIYRGMDLWHWREKYRGNWQTQIFLHYVNADGPNADLAYDGRLNLGDKVRRKPVRY